LVVNPYFLRLNFDKRVLEDDASSAYYDPASGYLTVTLTKEIPGEVFEGLDLLAKLLAPRLSVSGTPGIEVLGEQQSTELDAYDVETELVASTEKLSMGDPKIFEG
jgi:protein SHQ1